MRRLEPYGCKTLLAGIIYLMFAVAVATTAAPVAVAADVPSNSGSTSSGRTYDSYKIPPAAAPTPSISKSKLYI